MSGEKPKTSKPKEAPKKEEARGDGSDTAIDAKKRRAGTILTDIRDESSPTTSILGG